jgi:hypothetical protein
MTNNPSSDKCQLYLKLIEYKRSVGATQWTVFSIFVTLSNAILVLSFRDGDAVATGAVRTLALISYWLGFLLFRRYRSLNAVVARYLRELETDLGLGFQQYLDDNFPQKLSTLALLCWAGALYSLFAVVVTVLPTT